MTNSSGSGSSDFDALARQYWGMWGDAMRGSAPKSAAEVGMQGFQDAIKSWTGQAGGSGHGFDNVLGHFGRQNGDWFAQMQQVAAQFAGRDNSAKDIANAWQQALGGAGANPFEALFGGMRGKGLEGFEQWSEAAKPWLQGMRTEAMSALDMPTLGFTREHQEHLQALAKAQLHFQDTMSAYNTLMGKVSKDAYSRFETKLAEREEPGRQINSARGLFDLWIDAAEEAYAETALSPEFRKVYGAMVNAQMTLRSSVQGMTEQAAGTMGLPGRTEVDSAHRKIAELERQLRRMQRNQEKEAQQQSVKTAAKPSLPEKTAAAPKRAAKPKPAPKPASKPAKKTAKKTVKAASKPAAKKAVKKITKKKSVTPAARKPTKPASRKR
ncbi:MAG: class III poly(R)-hydroxyalkanoic acid synthase subunit PhaE [Thermomonas sp.]